MQLHVGYTIDNALLIMNLSAVLQAKILFARVVTF